MIFNGPKISIVTPSYNQGIYLRGTIESVMFQNYDNWEHIVIDGGSTDESANILKEYPHLRWISEKDSGPAEALKKGFNLAEGEIFAWINADDYYEKNIFKEIANAFMKNRFDILAGNITFIYPETNVQSLQIVKGFTLKELIHKSADTIRQAGVFFSSDIYSSVGGIDDSIKIVFDYDLFIKMLKKANYRYLNTNLAYQRMYSQTLTKRNLSRQAFEIFKIARKNGAHLTDTLMLKSVIRKILFPGMF